MLNTVMAVLHFGRLKLTAAWCISRKRFKANFVSDAEQDNACVAPLGGGGQADGTLQHRQQPGA